MGARDPRLTAIALGLLLLLAAPRAAGAQGIPPALVASVRHAWDTRPMRVRGYRRLVWLKVMSERLRPFIHKRPRRLRFLRLTYSIARREGVTPELALAVIEVESGFHRYAVSPVGAQGYMQVMPFWPRLLGLHGVSLFGTRTNLVLGCAILHYYIASAGGNLALGLQRYFGHANGYAYSGRVLTLLADRWYWR